MNQAAILSAYPRTHGRSCSELELLCDVRSVTTRMTELIRNCLPIVKAVEWEPNSWVKSRRVTYYELAGEHAQRDLCKTA